MLAAKTGCCMHTVTLRCACSAQFSADARAHASSSKCLPGAQWAPGTGKQAVSTPPWPDSLRSRCRSAASCSHGWWPVQWRRCLRTRTGLELHALRGTGCAGPKHPSGLQQTVTACQKLQWCCPARAGCQPADLRTKGWLAASKLTWQQGPPTIITCIRDVVSTG